MKAKVAIVILCYNNRKFLEDFLPSVINTAYENKEIIIADNCSTDDSLAFMEQAYPEIRIIKITENLGFAGGYNTALKKVESDYYVLLNSDVEVAENWLSPMVNILETDRKVAACQPKIKMHSDKKLFEHAGGAGGWMDALGYPFCRGRIINALEEDEGQYNDTQEIFWASGAAMCIRANLYHALGGLDQDYFAHMEEIDLCWRLKRAGYKIMVCPEGVVYHVGGGTLPAGNPRKTYLNFRNSLVTIHRNESLSKLIWLIPFRLGLDGLAALLFLTEGKFKDIWAILRAHFYYYFHLPSIIKKRRNSRKKIKVISIGPMNRKGIYNGSIVKAFYWNKIRAFNKIKLD